MRLEEEVVRGDKEVQDCAQQLQDRFSMIRASLNTIVTSDQITGARKPAVAGACQSHTHQSTDANFHSQGPLAAEQSRGALMIGSTQTADKVLMNATTSFAHTLSLDGVVGGLCGSRRAPA